MTEHLTTADAATKDLGANASSPQLAPEGAKDMSAPCPKMPRRHRSMSPRCRIRSRRHAAHGVSVLALQSDPELSLSAAMAEAYAALSTPPPEPA